MIIKCPSNCEHDYEFPHSIITKIRTVKINRERIQVIYMFVICRFCDHWIFRDVHDCGCPYFCHDNEGGLVIVRKPLHAVQ